MSPRHLNAVAKIASWSGEAHSLLEEIACETGEPLADAITQAARHFDAADELLTSIYLADKRTSNRRETPPRFI